MESAAPQADRKGQDRMGFGRKLLVGTVIVVGGLYTAGWFGAEHFANQTLDEAAARMNRGRDGANCSDREIAGFPMSFDLRCGRTTVAVAPGIKAEVAGLFTTARLLQFGRIETRYESPAKIEAPAKNIAGEARFSSASNTAELWIDGARRIGGAVDGLQLTLSGQRAAPIRSVAVAKGTSELASSSTPNSLDLAADVKGLQVTRTSGPPLPSVDVLLRATLLDIGGSIHDDDQVNQWIAAGGRARIAEATVTAQQTSISVSGDIAVAKNGLVSGKVRLRLVGLAGLPALAEAVHPGSREKAQQIAGLLSAMTKPVRTEKGPAQEIDLLIANGAILVGVIPLPVTIPPLF
jgi:hypothetical protein